MINYDCNDTLDNVGILVKIILKLFIELNYPKNENKLWIPCFQLLFLVLQIKVKKRDNIWNITNDMWKNKKSN